MNLRTKSAFPVGTPVRPARPLEGPATPRQNTPDRGEAPFRPAPTARRTRIHTCFDTAGALASSVSIEHWLEIELQDARLEGIIRIPSRMTGMVVFAEPGSGALHKPGNQSLAQRLSAGQTGVLRVELLTKRERFKNNGCGRLQNDPAFLAARLVAATRWVSRCYRLEHLPLGLLGTGSGGTAALMAGAALIAAIDALVVIDGQPSLAGRRLANIRAATLLVAGGGNRLRRRMNEIGFAQLRCEKKQAFVPGTADFASQTNGDKITSMAMTWFQQHLQRQKFPPRRNAGRRRPLIAGHDGEPPPRFGIPEKSGTK